MEYYLEKFTLRGTEQPFPASTDVLLVRDVTREEAIQEFRKVADFDENDVQETQT